MVFWSVISFAPPPWFLYVIGRIGTGFGESICNIAIPKYISEISSPKIRKKLLCLIPIFFIFGHIAVNAVGLNFDVINTSIICMVLTLICLMLILICPCTPSYYIKKNDNKNALKSLKFYHGKEQIESDLSIVIEEIERQKLELSSMIHLFTIQSNRQAMFIMVMLRLTHLFTGYPATIIYTHQIFIRAKVNIPEDIAVGIYIVLHLIFSVLGIFLNLTYKRKKFLIISFIGSFVFQLLVTIYFYFDELSETKVSDYRWAALLGICGYICFYSMGMNITPNLLFIDLFRDSIKIKASCLLNMVQGATFFTISKGFQEITDLSGQFTMFLIYTIAAFIGIIYVHYCVPETQGKTIDEIQLMLEENGFRYILNYRYRY